MKKNYILSGLMLIAALSLASCAKEQFVEQPAEKAGVPFEINAGVDTKTTTADGTTINWADGDNLNVFHAPAGTTTYGSNDEFTFTSGNSFSGTLADGALTEAAYDWYVLYPYDSHITTPANTSTGFLSIGSSGKSAAQVQTGYDSKAHLAGKYFPLYGKVENVAKGDKPSISLNQALSVIRITVKNGNDAPLTVSSISFTAPESIVGTYYIDFTGNTPSFTESGSSYVSNVATLTVKNGTELAKNATADFYIAVKPFTAKVNDDIKLSVNGFERTVKISGSDVTFAPGKIKTLSFNYNVATTSLALPIVDSMDWANNGESDATSELSFSDLRDVKKDGKPIYSASSKVYKAAGGGLKFGTSSAVGSITTEAIDLSSAYYISVDAKSYNTDVSSIEYVVDGVSKYTKELTSSYKTYIFNASPATSSSKIQIKITGKRGYVKNLSIQSGSVYVAPVIVVTSSTPIYAENTASSQTISYSIDNPTGASLTASTENSWISNIDCSVNGKVTFDISAQITDAPKRDGVITLHYAGATDVNVAVNQAAGPSSSKKQYTFTISADDFNTTSYAANNNEKISTATEVGSGSATINVKWTSNQVMKSSASMQWQKNNGAIYNSTDLGTIKSVTINKTDGTFTTYYGTSAQPTSGTTVGNGYFQIKVGGATGKTTSIVVVFEK